MFVLPPQDLRNHHIRSSNPLSRSMGSTVLLVAPVRSCQPGRTMGRVELPAKASAWRCLKDWEPSLRMQCSTLMNQLPQMMTVSTGRINEPKKQGLEVGVVLLPSLLVTHWGLVFSVLSALSSQGSRSWFPKEEAFWPRGHIVL